MKFKYFATITMAAGLVFITSCGSNLSGGVTLAQARQTCQDYGISFYNGANFETWVIVMETARDSGFTEFQALTASLEGCSDGPASVLGECNSCFIEIGAAVWK